jgi:aryl-alcohol dehydrogenase-like predicted oxidoreductase
MPGFASAQNYYNLVARQAEAELVPSCVEYGVSLIPYYPLGGGFLTGRDTRTELEPKKIAQLLETPDNVTVAANLRAFAEHRGHALFELAISWLCRRTRVASVIAGATSPEQVLANAQACDWQLHPDELAAIDLLTETSAITDPETPPIFAAPSTT